MPDTTSDLTIDDNAYEATSRNFEVSIVMPCLNEADTLSECIAKAQRALADNDITGEVVIADNGSTDGSPGIAARMGARVVNVPVRGYGNALMAGIAAAHGKYVVMGDADGSYDFLELPRFVKKLREGFDLVQGCRLTAGGGRIMPGAMPLTHRLWGNPMFSLMAQRMFWAPVHDIYCGLRAFTKDLYDRLDQRCTGMEFATEMVIKSSLRGAKIAQVPITLYPDGRKSHPPHLRTFRDGWRTLRYFLLCCPRWLFVFPGGLLIVIGFVGFLAGMLGLSVRGITFDAHTILFATLAVLCGYQSVLFGVFTKIFAVTEGLLPPDSRVARVFQVATLERGLLAAVTAMAVGGVLLLASINEWRLANFGSLDYSRTMRLVIPGVALVALGFQTLLSSFFLSILGLGRR